MKQTFLSDVCRSVGADCKKIITVSGRQGKGDLHRKIRMLKWTCLISLQFKNKIQNVSAPFWRQYRFCIS